MISLTEYSVPFGIRPTIQALAEEYISDVPKLTIKALCSHSRIAWLCRHRTAFIIFAKECGYCVADIAEYLGRDVSTINHAIRTALKQEVEN